MVLCFQSSDSTSARTPFFYDIWCLVLGYDEISTGFPLMCRHACSYSDHVWPRVRAAFEYLFLSAGPETLAAEATFSCRKTSTGFRLMCRHACFYLKHNVSDHGYGLLLLSYFFVGGLRDTRERLPLPLFR